MKIVFAVMGVALVLLVFSTPTAVLATPDSERVSAITFPDSPEPGRPTFAVPEASTLLLLGIGLAGLGGYRLLRKTA